MNFELILSLVSIFVLSESKRVPAFAPYIDITRETNLLELKQKYGVNAFHLAFALGGTGGCSPSWGGVIEIDDPNIIDSIKSFQSAGGDVIIATGGAMSPYLENSCGSVAALVGAYKKVLAFTGSTHLDIDVEAPIPLDIVNQALATLQQENPAITVSFTLMVQGDDYGIIDAMGVDLLKNAAKNGVNVDIVNPMTMEFGTSRPSWGDAVIAAAESTHKQMRTVWPGKSDQELYSMLGITPMIGRNFNGKVFDTNHAKQLVSWAKQNNIGQLAFWSIGRDKGCPGNGISPDCSSIAQEEHEFTQIFVEFKNNISETDSTPGPVVSTVALPVHITITVPVKVTSPIVQVPIKPVMQLPIDCSVEDSRHPDLTDCSKYFWCFGGTAHLMPCGSGTIWDTNRGLCNHPSEVDRPECK